MLYTPIWTVRSPFCMYLTLIASNLIETASPGTKTTTKPTAKRVHLRKRMHKVLYTIHFAPFQKQKGVIKAYCRRPAQEACR